jgi:quinol monooxygenase YgiN
VRETRVNIGFLCEHWMQDHLQKHLQSEEMIQFYIQTAKLDTRPIRLICQQIGFLAKERNYPMVKFD